MDFLNRLKLLLLILAFTCLNNLTEAQFIQKGMDIDGEAADDQSGYSVSMPDSATVAIGAWLNSDSLIWAGQVRVFSFDGASWMQKGSDIHGTAIGDQLGFSVSMPDANTLAVGAPKGDGSGTDAGYVRIYSWSGTFWVQKGSNIDGEAADDWSGYTVSMPDSNTVAIGAIQNFGSGFSDIGHVRVFEWNGTSWIQKGSDIDGEASGDESGEAISMPDANTVAIGAHRNDGNGTNAGHVRIYEWTGAAWVQKGTDIDGDAPDDNAGTSVSMPDANTIAIGAHNNDNNGANAGQVKIYRWNGSAWMQKGTDIDGEAAGDQFGWSVSMPDTNTVAIGGVNNDGNGTNSGHVRIYSWTGTAWVQKDMDIDGETTNDKSSFAISMPDSNTVAIGAPFNDDNGSNAGHVRVYEFSCNTMATISRVACDSFTVPSGDETHTISGTYMDTIPNNAGCDSLVTINLTVNYSSSDTDTVTACNSYTSPGGFYTTSGTYYDTIMNAAGCDSFITLELTILNSTTHTIIDSACGSYPFNGKTYYTSGTYLDTLTNTVGCDSMVTLELTVHPITSSTITDTACNSYNYIDTTYTTSGMYDHFYTSSHGCDSTVTLDLTIYSSTSDTLSDTACNSYHFDTLTYTTSGIYDHSFSSSAGCDSLITLDLIINTVDTVISQTGNTLTAQATDADYQWLDCNDNYTVIPGETGQQFSTDENGKYAVEIIQNGCIDTSNCYDILVLSAKELNTESTWGVFPNPASNHATFISDKPMRGATIRIFHISGQLMQDYQGLNGTSFSFDISDLSSGVYLVEIQEIEYKSWLKLLIE